MLFLEGNKLDKEKSPLWDPKTTLKGPFLVWFGPIFGSFFSTFLGNFHEFSAVSALTYLAYCFHEDLVHIVGFASSEL